MRSRRLAMLISVCLAGACCCVSQALAQSSNETGKLKIHVVPKQSYVWIDGKAIRDGSQTLTLPAGSHQVGAYNYGYLPKTQDVQVIAGQTKALNIDLQASGDPVPGPFGDIELKGHPRAAVLLNGKTPAYFVGHVDEFDWNWIWHQRLLVRPGTYQLTVSRKGDTIWSGPVTVKAGQQFTVYLDHNGKTKTKNWAEGRNMPAQRRFRAGIASATVAVAPVTAQLSAQSNNVACGQATQLNWTSSNAADTSISGIGEVPAQGNRTTSPTQDTTYVLTAKGPGGEVTKSIAVNVNGAPTVAVSLAQPEIHYYKVGDRVIDQGSTMLQWSTTNANSVKVEPGNSSALSGREKVSANPTQTTAGPINQTVTYTVTATNACGGTTTKTAQLHILGSIDPAPSATLASIYFPTAYPTKQNPQAGLVLSEKMALDNLATQFKTFGLYEHNASLLVIGYADVRGSNEYNQALSQRRAALIRNYLVSKGVPADDIKIRAEGKTKQLDQKTVDILDSKNSQQPEKWMTKNAKTTWLAYNRRADLVLEPTGQQSTMYYPVDTPYTKLVWQRPEPSLKKIESAGINSEMTVQQSRLLSPTD